jgi:ABC-type transport system involved in multi-copper enzyme maturation permease subunit
MSGLLIINIGLTGLIDGAIPDWYYYISLLNPLSVYSNLNSIALNLGFGEPLSITFPTIFSGELMAGLLFLWIIVFLLLSIWRFNNKDV